MEHIVTAAQLNAVCADLAATKANTDAVLQERERGKGKKKIALLQFQMSVLKTCAAKVVDSKEHLRDTDKEDDAVLRARIEARGRRIEDLEAALLK